MLFTGTCLLDPNPIDRRMGRVTHRCHRLPQRHQTAAQIKQEQVSCSSTRTSAGPLTRRVLKSSPSSSSTRSSAGPRTMGRAACGRRAGRAGARLAAARGQGRPAPRVLARLPAMACSRACAWRGWRSRAMATSCAPLPMPPGLGPSGTGSGGRRGEGGSSVTGLVTEVEDEYDKWVTGT